jgi:protocatechuate 3,4-dioxygenase beta subunit
VRSSLLLLASLLAFQVGSLPNSPGQPARDVVRRAEPTGTGIIRGRVVTADTGMPVRRAMVNLSQTEPFRPPAQASTNGPGGRGPGPDSRPAMPIFTRPRQTTTDAQGVFEFKELPEGSYRVSVFPGQFGAQYVGIAYGAKRPGVGIDPGIPIKLAAGAVFDKAIVALPRGGVITGRVTDDEGTPLAHVQVYGLWFPPGSTRGQRNGGGNSSDDLGQFRLFGLQPGEYAIVAEARMPTFMPPNMDQSVTEEERVGFLTTFYPGTPDEAGAQRVRAVAGAETTGIEIRLVNGRLLRMSGLVNDSQGRPATNVSGQVMRRTPGSMGFGGFGFSTDTQGRFQMRNIPPGAYRIIVRQRPMMFSPDGSSSDPGESAIVPVTLLDADIENLLIMTSPGATVKGQIVFENGAPSPLPTQMRVSANAPEPEGMGMGSGSAVVQPDLTFTLKGLMGEQLLRAFLPGVYLKAVTVGGDDITDTPREFKPQDRVTIIMTSRASTVEGTITDAGGAPATEVSVMLFSEDKSSWRPFSIRTRRAGMNANGHYTINGLMPGRYYIIAAPPARLAQPPSVDPSFFEGLAKDALTIVVGEDEQRTVDLKVVGGGL